MERLVVVGLSAALLWAAPGCGEDGGGEGGTTSGGGGGTTSGGEGTGDGGATGTSGTGTGGSTGNGTDNPLTDPASGPPAGNPEGTCDVPAEAQLADVSNPDHVVGDGTPESCTSDAFVEAVSQGGTIVFDCGPEPITITLEQTAAIYNDQAPDVVIDGGGLVTLSGAGRRRILYLNTCDPDLVWTTEDCPNQDHPRLTVQNLTFVDGFDGGQELGDGGSAIFARGGRLKILNSRFFNNSCDATGPDVGGAVRVFDQFEGQPLYVVNSTFGGSAELGNSCSNGAALSTIGVSFVVLNSYLSHNEATGNGANPAQPGTPGGGNGGAIYTDGADYDLTLCGTVMHDNTANEGGGAIFYFSHTFNGVVRIESSQLYDNSSLSFETQPGMYIEGAELVAEDASIE